jgi:hypothetical protein
MIQGEMHDTWESLSGSRRMPRANPVQPLHRIAEVMQQESIKPRTASRRMQVPMSQVQVQQDANCDLSLSDLYRWQSALRVPLVDLLVDPGCPLSTPVQLRANLLKTMKTVRSIQENADQESIQVLAENLVQQLVDMMPELREVPAWPVVGQRRTNDELGATAGRRLPDALFDDSWQGFWESDAADGTAIAE